MIGAARSKMSRAEFRKMASEALTEFVEAKLLTPPLVEEFLNCLDYVAIDATGEGGWSQLAKKLDEKPKNVRAFYLSVAPQLFAPIAHRLSQAGIATPESRIVVEKPLGHDLASARALNAELAKHFAEAQIYRIDHYLGKETVQNLMAIRFANALFEPLVELALRRAGADHRRRVARGGGARAPTTTSRAPCGTWCRTT